MKITEFLGALMFLAALLLFVSSPKEALKSIEGVIATRSPRIFDGAFRTTSKPASENRRPTQ